MARLIDADALTDELIKGSEAYTDKSIQTSLAKSVCMIICKAIENAPTIDAVEVVRCKDCKFFEDEDEDGDCWCYCHNDITHRDGYCSWGERREDGKTD